MKTVIVLNGSANSIIKQADELNSYIIRNYLGNEEIEAWILSDEEIDLHVISISSPIKTIKLIKIGSKHVAEEFLEVITEMYKISNPQIMIFGSEAFVSGLAVRTAYRLRGTSCVGVGVSKYYHGDLIVQKLVYSNNLTAKFIMKKMPFCISIAKGFKDNIETNHCIPVLEKIVFTSSINTDWLKSYKVEIIERENGLNDAKIVIVVGKGVGNIENIALIEQLASLLCGKLGASRPVVMNGWTRMDNLIGASGSIISPDICFAIGVSGAAAFKVGIEKSKFIIAINVDEKAPIFKIADVGICCKYQDIVSELIKLIKSE